MLPLTPASGEVGEWKPLPLPLEPPRMVSLDLTPFCLLFWKDVPPRGETPPRTLPPRAVPPLPMPPRRGDVPTDDFTGA